MNVAKDVGDETAAIFDVGMSNLSEWNFLLVDITLITVVVVVVYLHPTRAKTGFSTFLRPFSVTLT